MVNTCLICPENSARKLRAYLQEFDLLFLSDHRSVGDKASCGSDASPKKQAAAPRNEQQTGASV
jgi:hypothetical protein